MESSSYYMDWLSDCLACNRLIYLGVLVLRTGVCSMTWWSGLRFKCVMMMCWISLEKSSKNTHFHVNKRSSFKHQPQCRRPLKSWTTIASDRKTGAAWGSRSASQITMCTSKRSVASFTTTIKERNGVARHFPVAHDVMFISKGTKGSRYSNVLK